MPKTDRGNSQRAGAPAPTTPNPLFLHAFRSRALLTIATVAGAEGYRFDSCRERCEVTGVQPRAIVPPAMPVAAFKADHALMRQRDAEPAAAAASCSDRSADRHRLLRRRRLSSVHPNRSAADVDRRTACSIPAWAPR